MSSLKRVICLANSWKLRERCIAGIDIKTGKWIRPVCDSLFPKDGRVPRHIRLINGREPELLDIIEIPLADTGNNFGFESENLTILPGQWRLVGKATPAEILKSCESYPHILHNDLTSVPLPYMQSLSLPDRRTLQLIHAVRLSVESEENDGRTSWRGSFETQNGQRLEGIKITDPVFVEQLGKGYQAQGNFLITVSLGMPWRPPNWEGDDPCWKLIAGVIPLAANPNIIDLIIETNQEMQRIGWGIKEGRNYLRQRFNKQSRYLLSELECQQFLEYLQSLPSKELGDIPF